MASPIPFALLIFAFCVRAQAQTEEFIFNGFNGHERELTLGQVSIVKPSGLLRLTNRAANAIGHAFYSNPVQMIREASPTSPKASSFSTSFVFVIVPPPEGQGGYGFAFTLSPSKGFPGAAADHFLGIFNVSTNGQPSNHILAVEFDTVNGFNDGSDARGNHIGININGMVSNRTEMASYFEDDSRKEDIELDSGKPIQAWIDYDGANQVINVTICPMSLEKPKKPLISHPLNLTYVIKEDMYVGFSASTGKKQSSHYIAGWSFSINGVTPPLNLSQLPLPPSEKRSSSFQPSIIALIAALCAVTAVLIGTLLSLMVYRKKANFEHLEDWELDCPHRFSYRELYAATKGFKESEIIGVGGFGTVYKAVLHTTGNEVAVKRITRNSVQGLREFAAEIESLGRLRHRHLVNLQGWCKKNNDLLLVYDYIPNGSLDSLLFHPNGNFVLSWEQRFKILKGIAYGLFYLHEEWEQVVIHRDIKSSNVLIDAEMNGRLGDFGLARLYDHGIMSHTTNIVGTVGYIAPEMARTGKASTCSDVFAYGVLLLEVATGRRPIDLSNFILVDWVMECQQMGKILDAADTKLNSRFVVEEMELVLELGLFCSHQNPDARPTMKHVTRYLNGEDKLPANYDWASIGSLRASEVNLVLMEAISADGVTTSHRSSSIGAMSANSMNVGR